MYLHALSRGTTLDAKSIDIRRFLVHAWAATFAVVVLPALCVLSLLFFVEPDPPVIAVSAVSLLISAGASFIGSNLWMRREESMEVSFSDLMIWAWLKRRRAEARLARGAELLGLDPAGNPVGDQPVIGREQRLKILHELSSALESKDPYTHGHSQRVERHSFRIGAALGLSVTDLEDLRLAAALHDVGKIRVSDRILRKPGKLTPEEYKEIQDHSVVGAWMVSSVGNPDVISAVRHHHERFDGRGYPDGISGHDIPLFARIIGVADAYDAITSSRPYRAKAERDRAIKIVKEESGKQFDPMVVEAFLSSLPARVPVTAALAFLLPGPSRVVRKVASVARDVGGAGVAETVRAAGMTVVLSASVVAPVSQYVAPDRHKTQEVVRSEEQLLGSPQTAKTSEVAAPGEDPVKTSPVETDDLSARLDRKRTLSDGGGASANDETSVLEAEAFVPDPGAGALETDVPFSAGVDGGSGSDSEVAVGPGKSGGKGNGNGVGTGGSNAGSQGNGNAGGSGNGNSGNGNAGGNGNSGNGNAGGSGTGTGNAGGSGSGGSGNGNGDGNSDAGKPDSSGEPETGKPADPGNGNPGNSGTDNPGNSGGAGSGNGGSGGNGGSSGGNGGSGGGGNSGTAGPNTASSSGGGPPGE